MRKARRRDFLRTMAGGVLLTPFLQGQDRQDTGANDRLLDEIERRACGYFFEQADPDTGLVLDRAGLHTPYSPAACSIAATGFGLSAMCIADQRGYLDRPVALERVLRMLRFLKDGAAREHGFFYHFLHSHTGERIWNCELSSVDTTWLLCGVLHCRAYWEDAEIRSIASELLDRVDWPWMLSDANTLTHGWTPEVGFLPYHWDSYSELLAMYLLAISSQSHPIPKSAWDAWKRPLVDFEGIFYIDSATPIFVHQYSHAWFDFRRRTDRYADYFHNSQRATEAHRRYCIQLSTRYPAYGPDMWGVTASDSPRGYRIWGSTGSPPDGTLVPCAAGGSLVFLPGPCGTVLENMVRAYGSKVWSKYGFVDAFNPQTGWYSQWVLGIDLGIMLLMAENARTNSVWDLVMSTREAKYGMDAVGLRLRA
jgi:hypothetical protein